MNQDRDFQAIAETATDRSFVGELWGMVRHKKKYWLMPIIVVLLRLGVLVLLSGTAAAPFIYTLF